MDVLDIGSIEPLATSFEYAGAKYVVREPSGKVSGEHMDRILKIAKFSTGEDSKTIRPTATEGLGSVELHLIAACTFKVAADGKETPITLDEVKEFPSRVTGSVYRWLRTVGKMLEAEENPLKNSSSPTTAGSS